MIISELPVLYSFRRCPYAMRARLALHASQQSVALREIVLRNKPEDFLKASTSGTVPCLVGDVETLDESLDIMRWSLGVSDPEGWLDMPEVGWGWIARCDGPFKHALDRTKYGSRYPDQDPLEHREHAAQFLKDLEDQMSDWIFEAPTIADFAILPFVRQFAFIDKPWFDAQPWPKLQHWLQRFLASKAFAEIMLKYPPWADGDPIILFP